MVKIFFYLTALLNDQIADKVIILNYNNKNIMSALAKVLAKIILCNNRTLVYKAFVACNKCLSCELFFRERHVDFLICDFKVFNDTEDINKILMFIESSSIYSNKKVILIYNIHVVNVKRYYLISTFLAAKIINVFFIFTVKNAYLSSWFNCFFLVKSKKKYFDYLYCSKNYGSIFLYRQLYFLVFVLHRKYDEILIDVNKLRIFNFSLFLSSFCRFNINTFSMKIFLKKNLKYIFFI